MNDSFEAPLPIPTTGSPKFRLDRPARNMFAFMADEQMFLRMDGWEKWRERPNGLYLYSAHLETGWLRPHGEGLPGLTKLHPWIRALFPSAIFETETSRADVCFISDVDRVRLELMVDR